MAFGVTHDDCSVHTAHSNTVFHASAHFDLFVDAEHVPMSSYCLRISSCMDEVAGAVIVSSRSSFSSKFSFACRHLRNAVINVLCILQHEFRQCLKYHHSTAFYYCSAVARVLTRVFSC